MCTDQPLTQVIKLISSTSGFNLEATFRPSPQRRTKIKEQFPYYNTSFKYKFCFGYIWKALMIVHDIKTVLKYAAVKLRLI